MPPAPPKTLWLQSDVFLLKKAGAYGGKFLKLSEVVGKVKFKVGKTRKTVWFRHFLDLL